MNKLLWAEAISDFSGKAFDLPYNCSPLHLQDKMVPQLSSHRNHPQTWKTVNLTLYEEEEQGIDDTGQKLPHLTAITNIQTKQTLRVKSVGIPNLHKSK